MSSNKAVNNWRLRFIRDSLKQFNEALNNLDSLINDIEKWIYGEK